MMSAPTIGAPIGPDIPTSERTVVFDHVPKLRELISYGGWPGVVYAQVCIHNVKNASDREERPAHLRPIRGSFYYSIRGPKGLADMALVGTGSPIPGASPDAGERLFFTDGEVGKLTGLEVPYPIWLRHQPQEETRGEGFPVSQAAENREGSSRVQARQPAQRKQKRPGREKQKAGSGHSLEHREASRQRMKAYWAAKRAASIKEI
jgi:hypothetical protein